MHTTVRPEGSRHTSLLAALLLTCALVLAGLITAPPAHAATSASWKGTGSSETSSVSLGAGIYEVVFTYKDNVDPVHESRMSAYLDGIGSGFGSIVEHFAEAGSVRRIITLPKTTKTHLYVGAAENAQWTASVTKLTKPTSAKAAFTDKGTGPGTGSLLRLEKGTHLVKATYSGNKDPFGEELFGFYLRDEFGSQQTLGNEFKRAGTALVYVEIAKAGTYWLNVRTSASTVWTLQTEQFLSGWRTLKFPSISGTAKAGSTLTANPGTWEIKPASFTFQWLRAGSPIKGATKSTYKPTSADCGKAISVEVTGHLTTLQAHSTKTGVTAKVTCSRFSTAPTPTISGTTKVGSTLTAKAGTWKPTPTLAYQWYRGSSKISGATASRYTLNTFDCGRPITVKVTGKKANYWSTSAASKSVTPTAKGTGRIVCSTFSTKPKPTISGTAKVGSTLTAKAGTWKPTPTLTYQWLRDGAKISGATKSTYTLTGAERGTAITVKVTAKKSRYTSTSSTSAATKKVATGTLTASKPPTISGATEVGATLTAKPGTWKPTPTGLTYRWYRDGRPIAWATKTTYALTPADLGYQISVQVTATKDGYAPARASSPATTRILPPQPTISGAATSGSTLTADPRMWLPADANTTYTWTHQDGTPLDANGPTLTLTDDNVGNAITVRVISNVYGHTVTSRPSAPTAIVEHIGTIESLTPPTIEGTPVVGAELRATPGTWTPEPESITYGWRRNGKLLWDAQGPTYTVTTADIGATLTVRAVASKPGYWHGWADSSPTAPVTPAEDE